MKSWKIQKESYLFLTVLLAGLVTLSPFAIDSYLAAMPVMASYFGVHLSYIELTITLYFLGFAVGNFFGGPLSDSFGRKPIALFGVSLYAVSALAISFSDSIGLILFLRVTQAFGGGFATVTSNVFVRDWYSGKQVAKVVTIISMMMMLAPLFAPILGGFLVQYSGWQAVFRFMFGFASVVLIAFLIFVPETRSKELITRTFSRAQLFERYRIFLKDKLSLVLLFAISFSMAGMYIFLTSASFIYIDFFGVDAKMFPYLFGANVVLNISLSLLNTILLKRYKPETLLQSGLWLQLFAGLVLLVAVHFTHPLFWMVFAGLVLYMGSLGLVFGNGTAVILNQNPAVSASANAAIGILRFVLSFVIGSAVALFQAKNLLPIGIAMFFCTLAANVFFSLAMRNKSAMSAMEE